MKLIYQELYGINKNNEAYCIPTIKLEYYNEKDLLPNLQAYKIEEVEDCKLDIAYLVFNYGLFDCLSRESINKLDSLMIFINKIHKKDFINKFMWKSILFTTNISLTPIKKAINTNFSINKSGKSHTSDYMKDNDQLKVKHYYNSNSISNSAIPMIQTELYNHSITEFMKEKHSHNPSQKDIELKPKYRLFIPDDSTLPVLDIMINGYWGGVMNIDYEIEVIDELTMLYTFLDCLFSSEYKFYIKKCKHCRKYFIPLKSDTLYCSRKSLYKEDLLSCDSIVATLRKEYIFKKFSADNQKFLKSLKQIGKLQDGYIERYDKARDNLVDECLQNLDLTPLKTFVNDYKSNNPIETI